MKYILIDTLNLAFRCRHQARGGIDMQIGMAFHIILNSVKKMAQDNDSDHIVFCFDNTSWRKEHYPNYKMNRKALQLKKTASEVEDDKLFFEAIDNFYTFLEEKTNCTVLRGEGLEADDLISFWIDLHPDDQNLIISSDSDFVQLLSNPNVALYNGLDKKYITSEGVTDEKGRKHEFTIKSDSKISVGKVNENFVPEKDWYEWAKFLKLVRGDTSDNIFPSYPGARVKGSKNKIGIRDAFEDRHSKGYNWNNFMLQRWVDQDEKEHIVKDRYHLNESLIDLNAQPSKIKERGYEVIAEALGRKRIHNTNVGIYFMKFCAQWDLKRISDQPRAYAQLFNKPYILS